MRKYFYWFGIIGGFIYILTVIIGGFIVPNYSHINQAISEIEPLTDIHYRFVITILFGLYNIFTLLYGLFIYINNKNKGTSYRIQSLSILMIGLAGLLLYFFPMDIVGTKTTFRGIMHIVFISVIAPLTILSTFLGMYTYKDKPKMRWYSLITSIIVFVFGGLTAFSAANNMANCLGILERITIGSFILWLIITGFSYKRSVKNEI